MQISDKVVLVTGGASGLGGATAQRLVEAGGKVLIADVNESLGKEFAASLGSSARFARCDVTSEADAQAAVDAALAMGELVGLVNCAGIGPPCKTVGRDGPHPLDLFTKVVQINLIGS
ncbi:MAG: SDR family NAD(P)-dependent oxidoreductase, partial [Burkholderiaceae bacterium]